MTFIHPFLLGGLVLIGVPVIIHLIMRQQPKHLFFPAFRFLRLQHRTNQRKLRLRHLLLLLLRMLLIALLCLALARPRVLSDRFNFSGDRPVAAVLVLDTSPSMEYAVGGKTRLEDVKARALEMLDDLPADSRVAVLDCGDPLGEWQPTVSAAREKIANMQIRPGAGPLAEAVAASYRLFEELSRDGADSDDPLPRFLYVFSDRTPGCWDVSRTEDLKRLRDRLTPAATHVFVDVGVERAADLAIADVDLKPQIVPANLPVEFRVTVQAIGQDYDNQVQCQVVADFETKPVTLKAGQNQVITFQRKGLKPGLYQAEIRLATGDALPFNNARFVTFEVRQPRRILVLTEQRQDAWAIENVLKGPFEVEVKSTADAEVRALSPADLSKYQAVCLLSVPEPGKAGLDLWEKLEPYVQQGGGLAVFPGGEELIRDDYNREPSAARRLLPGELVKLVAAEDDRGVPWVEIQYQHPLMAPFRDYAQDPTTGFAENPRRALRYWDVKPLERTAILARYADDDKRPAVLESNFDRKTVRGKVLLFTTPFDERRDPRGRNWNDYNQDHWFYLVLVNLTAKYLTGEAEDANFNYPAGPSVPVPLPPGARFPSYTLQGPGLAAADLTVQRPENATELRLTQPRLAGNYRLTGGAGEWAAAFSLNPAPTESQLLPRVPPETIAELFGDDAVLGVEQSVSLKDKLDRHFRQPVDLFPWLMLILLVALVAESVIANRFYRRSEAAMPAEAT